MRVLTIITFILLLGVYNYGDKGAFYSRPRKDIFTEPTTNRMILVERTWQGTEIWVDKKTGNEYFFIIGTGGVNLGTKHKWQ